MPLTTGTWHADVDGAEGDLVLNAPDAAGTLTGSIFGVAFQNGFWTEREQKLTFVVQTGAQIDSLQVFIGCQFVDKLGIGPYLTGTVERFANSGG